MLAGIALSLVLAVSGQEEMALGLAAEQSGDLGAARRHLESAVRLSPNLGIAQVELLDVLVRSEVAGPPVDLAMAAAERMEPANPRLWRLEGMVFEARSDLEKARLAYEKSVALRGDDGPTRLKLGNVYRAQGKGDDALAQYRVATSLDAHDHLARLALADALIAQGDLPGAEKELTQLVAEAPKSPVYQQRLRDVRVRRGELKANAPPHPRKLRELKPSTR